MPNSLKCRLKNLVRNGLLRERDLKRIIIIPEGATNGDMIKKMFPDGEVITLADGMVSVKYKEHSCWVHYESDWWNAPYKISEVENEQTER